MRRRGSSRMSWRWARSLRDRAGERGPQGDRSRRRQDGGARQRARSRARSATEIRGHAAATPERVFDRANLIKVLYVGLGFLIVGAIGIALVGWRVAPFLVGLPVDLRARLAGALSRRQRRVRELGHRIRHLRAAARASHQQHDRHAVVAQAGGADRVLHQDRPRHPRREPAVPGGAAGRRARHRAGAAGGVRGLVCRASGCARKLRVDDEFAAMLSTAVSICGVSAAIAACGAIQGDKKKLSYVTSLVLIVAVPMMIVMPWIAKIDRHGRSRRRRLARRHARHLGLGGRGRRADLRRRHEDRRDREVLAERADRRRRLRAGDLVGAARPAPPPASGRARA